MVPFSGWNMPVQYTGILQEHMHTREKASVFDISHMGEFFLKGSSVYKDVDRLVTCRLDDVADGRCRYGFLLNEQGCVIDDMIIFRISSFEFMIVVNAGTLEKDREWICKNISSGTEFTDRSVATAKIDIQGPLSPVVMDSVMPGSGISGLKRFNFRHLTWNGIELLVSATGYTGEKGYEIFLPVEEAAGLWDAFLAIEDVEPAGLGARDSLRLEKGFSLYGHDIDESHTPLESGLERFVYLEKDFIGKGSLLERKERGFGRILTGFVCAGRRSAREKFMVKIDNKISGVVTSGVFSPCLKKGIGLCYIDKKIPVEGQDVILTDGRVEIEAVTKKPPFV